MIETIEELLSYAQAHDLPALAEHLDHARLLAHAEIASLGIIVHPNLSSDPPPLRVCSACMPS
jgi:hypothetical protein